MIVPARSIAAPFLGSEQHCRRLAIPEDLEVLVLAKLEDGLPNLGRTRALALTAYWGSVGANEPLELMRQRPVRGSALTTLYGTLTGKNARTTPAAA